MIEEQKKLSNSFVGAYIFVTIGEVEVEELRSKLLKIEEVHIVHLIIGPSDMIVYVEAESLSSLRKVLDSSIRELIDDGLICDTRTELVLQRKGGGSYHKEMDVPPLGSAWILITLSVGNPENIVEKLLKVDGIVNAHSIIGECDIIVYAETEGLDALVDIVDAKLKEIDGIKNTDTRLVLMKQSRLSSRKILDDKLSLD